MYWSGILRVGIDVTAQRAGNAQPLQLGKRSDQIVLALDAVDRRQHRGDRLDAELLGPRFIHVRRIHVADLLLLGARRVVLGVGTGFDDCAEVLLRLLAQRLEGAVARAVGGNLGLGHPAAVHIAEQVVLRPHALVEIRLIDAAPQRLCGHERLAVDAQHGADNDQCCGNCEKECSLHGSDSPACLACLRTLSYAA